MSAVPEQQSDLFGGLSTAAEGAGRRRSVQVRAVARDPEHVALANRLPAQLRFGTSTWSFSGWQGIVYDGEYDESRLAREGLAAYAQHPLLRAVGVDRSYYRPLTGDTLTRMRKAVSGDFRFLLKAHAALMLPKSASRPSFLSGVGDVFLDADHAMRLVVDPARRALGETLGVVLFQFSPLGERVLRHRSALLERLHGFLRALPPGVSYAIEWRDTAMLGADYQSLLADVGAVHACVAHPRMPPVDEQGADLAAAGPLVIRWLLAPGRGYQEAKAAYAPFDRLVDPDVEARRRIVELLLDATRRGREAVVIVNNKAEGSAPLGIAELARECAVRAASLG